MVRRRVVFMLGVWRAGQAVMMYDAIGVWWVAIVCHVLHVGLRRRRRSVRTGCGRIRSRLGGSGGRALMLGRVDGICAVHRRRGGMTGAIVLVV